MTKPSGGRDADHGDKLGNNEGGFLSWNCYFDVNIVSGGVSVLPIQQSRYNCILAAYPLAYVKLKTATLRR